MTGAVVWTMAAGPASITIDTVLPLGDAADVMRTRGDAPIFTITRCGYSDGPATVRVTIDPEFQSAHMTQRTDDGWDIAAQPGQLTPEDLIYLSYLVLESKLHRHGVVTLHGAAVERDGRAILLLGHAGAGKTMTAVQMCREFGYRLAGNDLVIVGGDPVTIHGGTGHLRLRHSSVSIWAPELLSIFDPTPDPWRSKVDIQPGTIGIPMSTSPSRLALTVFVHLDPSYGSLVVEPGDTLIHRLNLYENALRYVRGASTPWLIGPERLFGPYVPSLDSAAAHGPRTQALEGILRNCIYLAGTLDQITRHLATSDARISLAAGSQP